MSRLLTVVTQPLRIVTDVSKVANIPTPSSCISTTAQSLTPSIHILETRPSNHLLFSSSPHYLSAHLVNQQKQ
jgi:hypothetical protein